MKYVVKSYLIPYSTENETMFEDLRHYGFMFTTEPHDDTHFELYIMEKEINISGLENVMKWYV